MYRARRDHERCLVSLIHSTTCEWHKYWISGYICQDFVWALLAILGSVDILSAVFLFTS